MSKYPHTHDVNCEYGRCPNVPHHIHTYTRSKPTASVETCTCGRFRHTEHSGPPITELRGWYVNTEPIAEVKTMSAHTPGPWTEGSLYKDEATGADSKDVYSGTPGRGRVLQFVARVECDSSEGDANARLIAAAPEMLAIVRAAASLPCESQIDDNLECDDNNLCALCARSTIARALLARLEG